MTLEIIPVYNQKSQADPALRPEEQNPTLTAKPWKQAIILKLPSMELI